MTVTFEKFIRERKYLQNVSVRTLEWYSQSFHWLKIESPTQDDITACVVRMRDAGLSASSCNNRLRAIKAYVKWAKFQIVIPKLKEEQRVLPTFHSQDIARLARWKPKTWPQHRLQTLLLTLVDTGIRIEEALTLTWDAIEIDDLLLRVMGKANKQRRVPFTDALRRYLYRWREKCTTVLVFPTQQGRRLGRRNVLRDTKIVCRTLDIEPPERTLHAMRHTFSVNYLRRGGNVFYLQKILGHSTLEMTRKYANLVTEDLQAVHQRLSLLSQ